MYVKKFFPRHVAGKTNCMGDGLLTLMAILLLTGAAACGQAVKPTPTATAVPTAVSPFNYDASVPFDTKMLSQTEQEGVTVTEVSYAAHDPSFSQSFGGRTVAILVSPKGDGPFAGIVYIHWESGDRHEYLNEAVTMAQHGAVSLLPQGYFPWATIALGTQADRQLIFGQVIELRRAFDFLLAQPGVDPKRVGYVGHDWGGVYGGILAAVDKRPKTFVLIAGAPRFSDWNMFSKSTLGDNYLAYGSDLDPINFVPKAAPASLFFQYANNDQYLPENLAKQYYEAASQPKQIEWYDTIHEMKTDPVVAAHQAWLIEKLSLAP